MPAAPGRECSQGGSAEAGRTSLEARHSAPCSSWRQGPGSTALNDGTRPDDDVPSPHDSNHPRRSAVVTDAYSNSSSRAQNRPTGSSSAPIQHASPANYSISSHVRSRQGSIARAEGSALGPLSSSFQAASIDSQNSVTSSEGSWEQYTVSQQAQMLSSQQVSIVCFGFASAALCKSQSMNGFRI